MRHTRVRWIGGFVCAVLCAVDARASDASGWRCDRVPTEPCVKQRGRLSSQNGIRYRLWLVGTNRVLDVASTDVPAFLEPYLIITSDDHSNVFGDFEVCPLGPDVPGEVRPACIMGGERLVVQNLRRERPLFRLLSTWPKNER